MIRLFRIVVACVLALALPMQAAAFAMAKAASAHERIGGLAAHSHAHHVHADATEPGHDHSLPQDPCDDESNTSILKCCHTPAAWLDSATTLVAATPASFERRTFVARWTSFVPEEPSPPPIADLRAA